MAAQATAPAQAQDTNAHIDPAAQVADAGFVPVQTRSERPRSYEPGDFGTPTGREVNWKHTPVAPLAALFAVAEQNDGVTYEAVSGSEYVSAPLAAGTAPRG
ncbi:MAG TPA: Fe-S cluster assembly protein SufD, partial [Microbacterium sp.]|nr:Fe-S cluster assembly protein SufD [Microbacterium sp.]